MTIRLPFVFLLLTASMITAFSTDAIGQSLPTVFTKIQRYSELLNNPIGMAVANDESNRKYILEQTGEIRIIESDILLAKKILNLKEIIPGISPLYTNKTLLSVAFHPQFKDNKKLYVNYSASASDEPNGFKSVVAEFQIDEQGFKVNILSARIILEISETSKNTTGGNMVFGKDGFLYIGIADNQKENSKTTANNQSQNLKSLLGKILRIDINNGSPYQIPSDNPFTNDTAARPEIWAYGMHDPCRLSFDKTNGDLYCVDKGALKFEEINLVEKGQNYGWNIMEGKNYIQNEKKYNSAKLTKPLMAKEQKNGSHLVGGFVYRGKNFPNMYGKYVFCNDLGEFFYMEKKKNNWLQGEIKNLGEAFNSKKYYLNALGEDADGELFLISFESTENVKRGVILKFIHFGN